MSYDKLRDEMDLACQRYIKGNLEISDFIREVKRLQRKYHVVTITTSAQVSSRETDIIRATRAYGEKDVEVDEGATQ